MCPDFILELASPSDSLAGLQRKITEEWLPSGVQLAWLIDAKARLVVIFRTGQEPESLHNPASVQGDGPLRGFVLVLSRVWN